MVSYTIANVYSGLKKTLDFKLRKLLNKLKLFNSRQLFLFLLKFKLSKKLKLYNRLIDLNIQSKLIFCVSYFVFKIFFLRLGNLKKNILNTKYKRKILKNWLKVKFNFTNTFFKMFTDLILYCFYLSIMVLRNLFFINFIQF